MKSSEISLSQGMLFVASSLLSDNTYNKIFQSIHMRIFSGSFGLGVFILTTAYCNILVSLMGKPLVYTPLQTLDDISDVRT